LEQNRNLRIKEVIKKIDKLEHQVKSSCLLYRAKWTITDRSWTQLKANMSMCRIIAWHAAEYRQCRHNRRRTRWQRTGCGRWATTRNAAAVTS